MTDKRVMCLQEKLYASRCGMRFHHGEGCQVDVVNPTKELATVSAPPHNRRKQQGSSAFAAFVVSCHCFIFFDHYILLALNLSGCLVIYDNGLLKILE
jgi:hypothetical protein